MNIKKIIISLAIFIILALIVFLIFINLEKNKTSNKIDEYTPQE